MAQCYKPFFIKDGNNKQVLVPCGKCARCKARRVSAWSFRLMEHEKKSLSAHFITLTYNDENLSISQNGYRSLRKRDLQLFFKRLRRAHGKEASDPEAPIRYFAVGEYGGKIGRPHYHVILFNADIRKIQQAWSSYRYVRKVVGLKRPGRNGLYYKVQHEKVWNHMGFIHYGDKRGVCGASIGYTLKYILKPKDNSGCPDDDSEKEFLLMSQGIGKCYVDAKMVKWHRADMTGRMYCNLLDGKKCSMPRYYKDRIYSKAEREMIAEHSRNKFAEDLLKDLFDLYKNDSDYVSSYQSRKRSKEAAVELSYSKQKRLIKNQIKCVQ